MKCPGCQHQNADGLERCLSCGAPLGSQPEGSESPTLVFSPAVAPLAPGSLFAGRYQVIEDLGEGGMGRVYKVFDTEIKETLALKLILPQLASDPGTVARFQNELKLARKILHKNVCRLYELSRENETYYITMEYVEGEDLKNIIQMTKRLSPIAALPLARQLCSGLAEAHRQGVVHRDLKPQNVIVDKNGNVRIMDFGLARSFAAESGTRPGRVTGTPEYMSPEQAERKDADGRSDIYSLGVILYEILTGALPFSGRSAVEILHKQKNEPPVEPVKLQPDIPERLNRVILQCLAKRREDRYQTADELDRELESIEAGIRPPENRTRRQTAMAAPQAAGHSSKARGVFLVLLLAAVTAAGIFLWRHFASPPRAAPSAEPVRVAVITFLNQTGDPSYDHLQEAIPNLLITSLEQAEGIRVTAWERLSDLLKQLGRPPAAAIDRDLGFELCRLDGIDVIILGSYIKAGDIFVTDAKAYEVRTKTIIRSVSARGAGVESLLNRQIDELSAGLARALTTPEMATRASVTPIIEMTTDNMEAYELFLKGREAFENLKTADARDYLEKAVDIDPGFSLAYIYLARLHSFTGDIADLTAVIREYRQHQRQAPGREGLYLEALAARFADNDREKYFQTIRRLVARYPQDKRARLELALAYQERRMDLQAEAEYLRTLEIDPRFGPALNFLAYFHLVRNQYDQAVEYFERYAAAYPAEPNPHDSLAEAHFFAGRFGRAIEKYKDALRIKPDFGSDFRISYCYAVQEDYAEALRWTDRFITAAKSNQNKSRGYVLKGFYCQLQGRLDEAFREWEAAEALLRSVKDDINIDLIQRCRLWTCFYWGRLDRFLSIARARREHRLRISRGSVALNDALMRYYEGLCEAGSGNVEKAQALRDELRSLLPAAADQAETAIIQETIHHLTAEVFAARGQADQAIAEFGRMAQAGPDMTNIGTIVIPNLLFRGDLPARALAARGDLDKAISEYERLLDPMNTGRRLTHPLVRYRLAKLYERKGLDRPAIEHYRRLGEIWKDADAGLEAVRDARSRLASLRDR